MNYHDWKSEKNPIRRTAKRLLSGAPLTDGRPLSELIELDERTRKELAFEANPGEGKTYFAMRLAAACTNRKPLPGMELSLSTSSTRPQRTVWAIPSSPD